MRFFLAFLLFGLGISGFGSTVDIPFDLARSAREWTMFGVDLALPGLSTNPAAVAFAHGWDFSSTFSSVFGALQVWSVSLRGAGLAGEAVLLDSRGIGPNLNWRVWAFRVGGGVRLNSFALGAQARFLRPKQPRPSFGWALDLGIFWLGPVYVGGLAEALLSSSPYVGEPWPPDFSFAVAFPVEGPDFSGTLGVGMVDVLAAPTWALSGELVFGSLSLRGGLSSASLFLGGGVDFEWISLDWVFTLHPDLPLSFRVSFDLKWP